MRHSRLAIACLIALALLTPTRQSLAAGSGSSPIPAQWLNGSLQSAWDGSYSDLLAADALALCWTTQQDPGTHNWLPETDGLITGLMSHMTRSSCHTTCSNPAYIYDQDIQICAYLDSRKDAYCNMDPATSQYQALDVSSIRSASQTASYVLPTDAALGITTTSWGTSYSPMRASAQQQVSYADLTLCMAEQLRQKLDTVQVAFTSTDDLARVQELIRELSLTSVYQYSMLNKVFTSTAALPTLSSSAYYYTDFPLIPLMKWYRSFFTSAMAKQFGDDFAEAIKLLVEATESSIELKMRDPAAQGSFGKPDYLGNTIAARPISNPKTGVWSSGLSGPREDILERILYDGYDDTGSSGRPRGVQADTSDPKVGVLLGLARSANAIKLHYVTPVFDGPANAAAMLLAVENFVRNLDCTTRGIPPGSCSLANSSTPASSYMLWARYGIGLSHAQSLVDSLTQALFGQGNKGGMPWSYGSGGFGSIFDYSYDPYNPTWYSTPAAANLTMHFFGVHQYTGDRANIYTGVGDVILDPNFRVEAPSASDLQSMRGPTAMPVLNLDPTMSAASQIGSIRLNSVTYLDPTGHLADRRSVGSSTALALARESLMQLAAAPTTAAYGILVEAGPALALIEKAIGSRQVLVRQTMIPSTSLSTWVCPICAPGVAKAPTVGGVVTNYLNVDVLTKNTDSVDRIAIAPGIPLAATLVRDPNTTTLFGDTQASAIASLTYATPSQITYGSAAYGSDYVMRSTSGTWPITSKRGVSVILKSSVAPTLYIHAFTGRPGVLPYQATPSSAAQGTAVTFGGQFAREVTQAWTFDAGRWAVPKYDGFGLPHDWVPGTDASLFDEPAGTSVESHFLERASTAAEESVGALQQAFDTLQQETIDTAALQSSDARAQQLTALQYQSLCGAALTCSPGYTSRTPTVPACSPANTDCETFRTLLGSVIGSPTTGTPSTGVPLASAVASAIVSGDPAPTFGAYQGGSLQGLLLDEWTAWKALNASLVTAIGTAQSAIAQVTAAKADLAAAKADEDSVDADVASAYAQIAATDATIAAQQVQYNDSKTLYTQELQGPQNTVNAECSHDAFVTARQAGFSYAWGGPGQVRVDAVADDNSWHVQFQNSTWSPGPIDAQAQRCDAAKSALAVAQKTTQTQTDIMTALLEPLSKQSVFTGTQKAALPTRLAATKAHVKAASAKVAEATSAVASQEDAATQNVQAALGQLMASMVAIDHAYAQAGVEAARIAVDQQQASLDIRTRFGVRARYHSYDLWRARALTENARRLAVAARRAIEARYVTDLSTMKAAEPFVEAPAVWADQIYSSDLRPFSIGLTQASTSGSGLNANAVKDYVGNLKLFLDGFAVERPSAAVLSDAEAIQLPAPAQQVVTSADGAPVDFIDPASSGWSFYCDASNSWISDPDIGKFLAGAPTWTLATACGGSSPTLARLSFSLDPWGRTQGSIANPPYAARYNVRTRAIALNLVGSGIRSCERTPDPSTCYSEPFIRYDLKHVGPAWVTSYDQTWHSLAIPKAVIEGGKALATEEWLDPVSNGFNRSDVANVSRSEFVDRPIGGAYELTLRLTPDVNVERIERIQVLTQTNYWVRQE